MTDKERALGCVEALKKEYPDALCSLEAKDPLQLLIATRLSAQCTDATLPDFRQRATSKRYAATFPAEYQSFPKEYRAAQERFRRLSEKHARQNVTTTISMMRILKTSSMTSRKKTKHPKRTKRLKKTASRCEQMSRKKPPFRAAF